MKYYAQMAYTIINLFIFNIPDITAIANVPLFVVFPLYAHSIMPQHLDAKSHTLLNIVTITLNY